MTDELTLEIDEIYAKAYAYLMNRRRVRLARAAQLAEQASTAVVQDITEQNSVENDVQTDETA